MALLRGRDWYFIAEQLAPAPYRAHPGGCAALSIERVTVPRASRTCEPLPDGFDLHLLHAPGDTRAVQRFYESKGFQHATAVRHAGGARQHVPQHERPTPRDQHTISTGQVIKSNTREYQARHKIYYPTQ